jgi:SMC interacting uncharacterized protein involved in chromosome segregation
VTIIRELVTKLSFKLDRAKLDTYQGAIANFKKSIVTSTGDIANVIGKTIDFFRDLASSTLNVKDLASYARIATDQFVAMRQAAKELGVDFEVFDKAALTLSKGIEDSYVGTGKLFKLIQQSRGRIKLPNLNDQANSFKNTLDGIYKVIGDLPTRADKLRVIGEIFNTNFQESGKLLRAFDQGKDKFDELTRSSLGLGKTIEQNEQAAEKYAIAINKIEGAWSKVTEVVKANVIPVLGDIFEFYGNLLDKFMRDISSTGKGFGQFLQDVAFAPFEINEVNAYQKSGVLERAGANNFSPSVVSNNKIEINVPPGTTEAAAHFMADAVQNAIDQAFQQNTREIINNNPMFE